MGGGEQEKVTMWFCDRRLVRRGGSRPSPLWPDHVIIAQEATGQKYGHSARVLTNTTKNDLRVFSEVPAGVDYCFTRKLVCSWGDVGPGTWLQWGSCQGLVVV